MDFTIEEEHIMWIFETGSRKILLNILREALKNDIYDLEMREIYASTIGTANLIKALEAGKGINVISAQIEKRQQEKADLKIQLAKEKIQTPLLK